MRRLCLLLMLLWLPCIFLPAVLAQDTASIVGTVTDPSGAAIPNVRITVANPDKGINRTTTTDSIGAYRVGPLPIGAYSVTAEAQGFQKLLQTGITLEIGQIQRADLRMVVGATTQEVTVTGNVARVQTDTAVISSVIGAKEIAAINLNGRSFTSLATLIPGATTLNSYNPLVPGTTVAAIAFSGTRQEFADWNDDGGNMFNFNAGGNFHGDPSIDSIGEFQISTSTYGADQGIRTGAVVQMTTKAGTQAFHGDAYEYIRNQVFDANPWFVNQQRWDGLNTSLAAIAQNCGGNAAGPCNAPKTPLKWNNFGFTVGGPVYIPGHYNTDKSKTFFFWSQEFRRLRQGTTITAQAPTARMRRGDFSECDSTSANYNNKITNCVVPKDPANGNFYTREGNGLVPVSTQAADLLNTWVPLPNNGPVGWIKSPNIPTTYQQQIFRVDQNLGNNMRVFVRYLHERYTSLAIPTLNRSSIANFDSIQTFTGDPIYNFVINVTNTIKPTIVNTVMIHYDHKGGDPNGNYDQPGPGWPAAVLTKPADWSMQNIFPGNASQTYMPGFTVSGGGLSFGEDAGPFPGHGREWNGELTDNLAISHGSHFIKTGFLFFEGGTRSTLYNYAISSNATAQGELSFSTASSLTTGNALADMDLGRINTYAESSAQVNGNPIGGYLGGRWHYWGLEPYVQDDWRITRRLTLNIGLRAYYFSLWEDQSRIPIFAGFSPSLYNRNLEAPLNASGILVPNAATGQIYTWQKYGNGLVQCRGGDNLPVGCQYDPGTQWAGRFGFAYQPFNNPRTVIRGGYGMFYDFTGNGPNPKTMNGNVPVYAVSTASNVNGFSAITAGLYGPAPFTTVDLHQQWPLTQQFSLGVQHEFSGNDRFGLSYVGNITVHTSQTRNLNMVPVGSTTVNVPSLAGTANCDTSGNCDVQQSLINQKHSSTFFVPYAGFTSMSLVQDTAQSNYHSLQAEWRHTVGRGLTMEAAYTYSHLIDNGSSQGADPNVDDSNLHRYYATSGINRTQVAQFSYDYELPFLKNTPNRYLRNAFGGWEMSGITSFWTGQPVNMTCSISGHGTGIGANAMCNSLAPLKIQKGVDNNPNFGPVKQWYNPAVVGQLTLDQLNANGQPGMFGYMGLNALTGPGRNNWDLAMLKNFSAPWFKGEHSTIQFRWETYNTFNHPQWNAISAGCGSATPVGTACSGNTNNQGKGDVTGAWNPRNMQFALKLIF